jgi:hypothetical protein
MSEAAANYGAGCEHLHEDQLRPGPISFAPAPEPEKFEAWGFVELMGHNRIAGKLSEQCIAGRNFLRVDVPQADGSFRTQYYGASAIFAMHPTDEATARKLVQRMSPEPVFAFMLDSQPRLPQFCDDDHDDDGN